MCFHKAILFNWYPLNEKQDKINKALLNHGDIDAG